MKIDLPSFGRHLHIEDFLDWMQAVDNFFDYMEIHDKKWVKLVAYKLCSRASVWWDQLQVNQWWEGRRPVNFCPQMRQLLRNRFLPPDYDQMLYKQYQNWKQSNCSIFEYTKEFYRLNARNDLAETESQQVAQYISGLK